MKQLLALGLVALSLTGAAAPAFARSDISELSAMSLLPVAVSVAAPVALLSAGATLTVVAIEATSAGTVWVMERASDGARASVTLSGAALEGSAAFIGGAVMVTAFSAGTLLSTAGRALCFIPNARGRALLYNERVTR
jgi:hypothetical protein